MSAADVETQSQQETTNGTSKFDVPEIELIIKVGNIHYTTHTHVHIICLRCMCVLDFFMRALQIFCLLHNKVKMLLHIQQQKKQQQQQQ